MLPGLQLSMLSDHNGYGIGDTEFVAHAHVSEQCIYKQLQKLLSKTRARSNNALVYCKVITS